MEKEFVCFLDDILKKKDVKRIIADTLDVDLKRLMIYVYDDYFIKNDHKLSLLEMEYYKTRNGGEKFYEYLDYYHSHKNYAMVRLYLMSLQFGFTGYYVRFPKEKYLECLDDLKINFTKETTHSFHVVPIESHNLHFIWIILVPLFTFICTNLFESLMIYSLIAPIQDLHMRINV